MEDLTYIPNSTHPGDNYPEDLPTYIPLVKFIYNNLSILRQNNQSFTIKLNFFNLGVEPFNDAIRENELAEEYVIPQTVSGLNKILKFIIQPGFQMSRAAYDTVAEHFINGELNVCIRTYARQLDQTSNDQTQIMHCFIEVCKYFAKANDFLLNKTIRAANLYMKVFQWSSQINSLDCAVTNMLLALSGRAAVNDQALELARLRNESLELFTEYINFSNPRRYTDVSAHFEGLQIRKVNFNWGEFTARIASKEIWFYHSSPSNTQLTDLLQDTTLGAIAKRLDQIIEKIRNYAPSADIENLSKKDRMKELVDQVEVDFNKFKEDPTSRNASKAKIIISTLQFLLNQLNSLHVDGVSFNKQNTGTTASEIADKIEDLEKYLAEQDSIKKQKELSAKMSSMEFSKRLPGLQLTKLMGPHNYLNWVVSFNQVNKLIQNPITKLALIKSSLGNKTDRKFLETSTSVRDCIQYLAAKYSNKLEILHCELEKLYKLKKCGDDLKLMLSNSEKFHLTVNLLSLHGLISNIDNIVRSRVMNKIMTSHQQNAYLCDLIKAEQYWKSKYQPQWKDDDNFFDIDDLSFNEIASATRGDTRSVSFTNTADATTASTPYGTPTASPTTQQPPATTGVELVPVSSALDHKYTNEQLEKILESKRRDHYLRHAKRYFEATRRALYTNTLFPFQTDDRKPFRRKNYGETYSSDHHNDNSEKKPCILCKKYHKNSLFFCYVFRKMSPDERHHTLSTNVKEACKKCLSPSTKDENHRGGQCQIQEDYDLKCRICDSTKHNTLLHKNFDKSDSQSGSRGGQGGGRANQSRGGFRGRGRGGRGRGRGGQYRRETRKQRLSRSEKAYYQNLDEDDDDDHDQDDSAESCEEIDSMFEDSEAESHVIMINGPSEQGVFKMAHSTSTHKLDSKVKPKTPAKPKSDSDNKQPAQSGKQSKQKHLEAKPRTAKKSNSKARDVNKDTSTSKSSLGDIDGIYISCTSRCDVTGKGNSVRSTLCLWDTGSSMNFCLNGICQELDLIRLGEWRGRMSTINGNQSVMYPIYLVPLKTNTGKVHHIPCMGIDHIGIKNSIDQQIYKKIADTAGVQIERMDTTAGEIGLLLGAPSVSQFPTPILCPKQKEFSVKYPNLKMLQCKISKKLFPFGMVSNTNKSSNMLTQCENFGIFSNREPFRSSFRLKKNPTLKLSIPSSSKEEVHTVTERIQVKEIPKNKPITEMVESCVVCQSPHKNVLSDCDHFIAMTVDGRYAIIYRYAPDACRRCLAYSTHDEDHHFGTCDHNLFCDYCGSSAHHTLLHRTLTFNFTTGAKPKIKPRTMGVHNIHPCSPTHTKSLSKPSVSTSDSVQMLLSQTKVVTPPYSEDDIFFSDSEGEDQVTNLRSRHKLVRAESVHEHQRKRDQEKVSSSAATKPSKPRRRRRKSKHKKIHDLLEHFDILSFSVSNKHCYINIKCKASSCDIHQKVAQISQLIHKDSQEPIYETMNSVSVRTPSSVFMVSSGHDTVD